MSAFFKNNQYAFYISNEINKKDLIAQIVAGKIIERLAFLKVAVFQSQLWMYLLIMKHVMVNIK